MRVFLTSKADRQLMKLPSSIHDLIISKLEQLAVSVYFRQSKKLMNREGWRMRIGDYRVIYKVDKVKKEILILSISHRREAYR